MRSTRRPRPVLASKCPKGVFGAVTIRERCGECDERPVAVTSVRINPAEIDLMWACDDHIEQLGRFLIDHGLDPGRHVFEISRTCRARDSEMPCGAAADYLVLHEGGEAVLSVCKRHLEAWRPADAVDTLTLRFEGPHTSR